ncbi:hypothetical protein ALTERO38_20505 [Alteromonas sp. 38]|nr:hypothetical protein ALTERO38_20505 [Alteromonas sp. 38]
MNARTNYASVIFCPMEHALLVCASLVYATGSPHYNAL